MILYEKKFGFSVSFFPEAAFCFHFLGQGMLPARANASGAGKSKDGKDKSRRKGM